MNLLPIEACKSRLEDWTLTSKDTKPVSGMLIHGYIEFCKTHNCKINFPFGIRLITFVIWDKDLPFPKIKSRRVLAKFHGISMSGIDPNDWTNIDISTWNSGGYMVYTPISPKIIVRLPIKSKTRFSILR